MTAFVHVKDQSNKCSGGSRGVRLVSRRRSGKKTAIRTTCPDGLFTIPIISGSKKIVVATATIRSVTDVIVSEAETTISMAEKMVSAAKKIVSVTDPLFFVTDPLFFKHSESIDKSAGKAGGALDPISSSRTLSSSRPS